jgi:beta-lactamase class A
MKEQSYHGAGTKVSAPFFCPVQWRHTLFLLIGILMSHNGFAQRFSPGLEQGIREVLGKQKGFFAVACKDLTTGRVLVINEREVFHAASTMKTPVMIEIFKQASLGNLSLHDSIEIRNEFKSIVDGSAFSLDPGEDSEQELYKAVGQKRTISALVYDMIIASSNLATNLVIELADAKKVTRSMRELGAKEIQVLRGVEDSKAYAKGLNNTTTALDLMIIFEKMARNELITRDASEAMINILLDQRFNEVIPAKLPEGVKVAHKTGNISGVEHDGGIIILPDGRRYVLVLLSKKLEDKHAGIEAMATVSEIIYREMMRQ